MELNVIASVDLSVPSGDTIRVLGLLSGFKKDYNINLIVPKASRNTYILNLPNNITILQTNIKLRKGSLMNFIANSSSLLFKSYKLKIKGHSKLLIETCVIGGILSLLGYKNYILDIHGLLSEEVEYNKNNNFIIIYSKILRYLEKKAIYNASKVIVVSRGMKDYLINDLYIDEKKIVIIPNGYSNFSLKNISDIDEIEGMVSFVGSLTGWANVEKVIEAAYILRNEYACFYIIGDGPYKAKLESMAESLGLNNVKFTGFVPMDKAYEYMAKSQILLAPFPRSLALEVACPIKLIEYMALGKAIIADDVGDLPSLLKKNEAGLISDPSNSNEFIENIGFLLRDGKLREKLSSNALELSKNFSWAYMNIKLEELLNE